MLLTMIVSPVKAVGQTTETLNITSYATANSWVSGTAYTPISTAHVTITGLTNGNNSKYYSSNNSWRHYEGDNGTVTLSVSSDYTLSSVTFTYAAGNSGVLKDGTTNVTSGTEYALSGTTKTFSVGHSSGTKNGNVQIQNIVINIQSASSTTTPTSITIDASGITNTNVFVGTAAGSFSAAVTETASGDPVVGAAVTWTSSDEEIATIGETTGAVTLVAAGTTTITANYAGNSTYSSSSKTYSLTVINQDPNAPGSVNNPYTVAQAIAAIDDQGTINEAYATGIVCQVDSYNSTYHSITYWISDDGTTTTKLQVYSGKGIDGANFSSKDDIEVGATVVVKGKLKKYNTTYEFDLNNQLVTYVAPVVDVQAPTITPASCGLETSMDVTITPADGTTIYYTTDGSDPDNSGTGYTTMQTIYGISETTTVKAIAYIGEQHSNVVSAVYTKITDIENITAVNTTYFVKGTVVATNSRGYVIGDGSEYVYVYLNAAPSVAVNNMVYVYGTTGTYGNIIQFTSSATVSEAGSTNYDGNPAATVITEVPNYSTDYHLSTYLEFEGALAKSGSNYLITLGESQIQISYPTTAQGTALDALADKNVHVKGYFSGINSSSKFTVMLESVEEVAEPAITLAQYEYNLNADGGDAELPVTYTNMPSDPQAVVLFYEIDGETALTENPNWITATINEGHNIAGHIDVNEGEARSAYFKVKGIDANDNEVYSNLVTINQAAAGATIEFNQTSMTLDAGGESDRKLSFDYSGLGNNPTFSINYYEQDGTTAATYDHDWLTATFEDNKVNISAVANTGEARSAYFRVYGENGAVNTESNLVTITQAEYVVDYATLPFSWAGNTSAPTGITNNGVGTYSSSPYLRFDGTGDYIILKINERPGVLSFDIKGNGFSSGSTSTFKVQTSTDGTNYADLATYTELGETSNKVFDNLGAEVRYIKWIYTEKGATSGGNVALGNIVLAVYDSTPSLSFNGSSANIGTYPTGEEITFDGITVSQNNLTENITLSATKGTLTPNSIDAGANPTQVVWKYTPTEAVYTTATITATSGTLEDSFEIQFVAKTPHSITIASSIEHGTVESNKETAIENENVDLTVTPDDGYELSEITVVDSDNIPISFVENTYRFVMPDKSVTVSATFTQSSTGDEEWVLTDLADLTSDDVFVIVGDNGDTYAMNNTLVSNTQPSAISVSIDGDKIDGTVENNMKWNVTGNSTDGYVFHPNGDDTNYLYCSTTASTGSNTNMRIGTQSSNIRNNFVLDNNHLATNDDYTKRYVHLNGSTDWRGYVNSTTNSTTIAFYKKTNGTTTPSITASNVNIEYNIEEGEIAYTINHPVEGGTVSAEINGTASWLYLDDVDQTNHKVPFLCDANDGAERAATVTLTYTYNTDETVTKSITITQAANPNVVDNISDITATGSYTVKGTIVAKSERGFIVGDGTGYVYYYNQNYDQSAYNIGDKVKLAGPVVAYGKVFEFNSETVVSESETSGYDPTNAYPTELTGAQMQTIVGSSDNRLSDFVVYHGTLSVSVSGNNTYYNITNISGATTATGSISYPLNTDFASLDGEQVTVIGYFVGVSSTRYNTMIGAVVKTPSIVANDVTINYNETSGSIAYTISDAASDGWFNAEVEDGSWITITQPIGNDAVAFTCDENTGDAARTQNVTLLYSYHNYQDTIEKVVTVTQQPHIVPVASITVDPTELNVNADEHDGLFTVAYENIETDLGASVVWFESDGVTVANEPEWITADINDVTLNVDYIIDANTGDARTAYFKVYGLDDNGEDVYSNLVTITQAAPVIDYATLPFEWAGGTKEDLVANVGVSGYGLGSNYAEANAPYRVKFDTNGDYILVKTNEQPGEVTVGIKKLGGANASSITIKGSSNGEDFSTIQTFDNEGDANAVLEHTTTVAFNENDRYVMIYFNKPSGGSNVGVGPITIAQVDNTPSISINPGPYNLNSEGGDAELEVTYSNMPTDPQAVVIFYESNGETPLTENPTWITATINANGNVDGHIDANTGDARSAYFKVKGIDGDNNPVYSELVTINQAAYTLSIVFETTSLDIEAGGEQDRIISFEYEGLGENPTFTVRQYDATGQTQTTYDWLTTTITDVHKVNITVAANTGDARSAYFKVYGENGTVNTESNLVTINQAAAAPAGETFTLLTNVDQIVAGQHYLITNGSNRAMGEQNPNNRAAVDVTISAGTATYEGDDVYEVVISGPDANGNYSIYDQRTPGYLFAASSGSNYLRTRAENSDNNSMWKITIDNEGVASIIAQGSNSRNVMRYNGGSSLFACYASASQSPVYLFKKNDEKTYNFYSNTTVASLTVDNDGACIVHEDVALEVTGTITNNGGADNILIENLGQLINKNNVVATLQRDIKGYGDDPTVADGWQTIASPVDGISTSVVATAPYDLYMYNEPNAYWYSNTGSVPFNTLSRSIGYLYANANDMTLNFAGEMIRTDQVVPQTLSYTSNQTDDVRGYNLMGNPFTCNLNAGDIAWINGDAEYFTSYSIAIPTSANLVTYNINDRPIKTGEGFFVQASDENQEISFVKTASKDGVANNGYISINANTEVNFDNAYIQIGNGNTLRKMSIATSSVVYVMNDGDDYAAARVEELAGSMPVYFDAAEDGQCTITITANNLVAHSMHLIDNFTGEDIDLLASPSYTFFANESDDAARFTLMFDFNDYTGVNESYVNGNFAYQSGDELFISGDGTLQVFDVMGRFVMSKEIHGSETVSVSAFETGVYMLRFVGETVMTQKIVIR